MGTKIRYVWVRLGDNSEYEKFDNVIDVANYLTGSCGLHVGSIVNWLNTGFTTNKFQDLNYISVFWGDAKANLSRLLNNYERAYLYRELRS
jgi:hypothetical protein